MGGARSRGDVRESSEETEGPLVRWEGVCIPVTKAPAQTQPTAPCGGLGSWPGSPEALRPQKEVLGCLQLDAESTSRAPVTCDEVVKALGGHSAAAGRPPAGFLGRPRLTTRF